MFLTNVVASFCKSKVNIANMAKLLYMSIESATQLVLRNSETRGNTDKTRTFQAYPTGSGMRPESGQRFCTYIFMILYLEHQATTRKSHGLALKMQKGDHGGADHVYVS